MRGDAYTNTIEGFFWVLKRGIYGTYQSVSQAHLHRYLAEFDFRYSNRLARLGSMTLNGPPCTLTVRKASGSPMKRLVATGRARKRIERLRKHRTREQEEPRQLDLFDRKGDEAPCGCPHS